MIQQVIRAISPANNPMFGGGNPSSTNTTLVAATIFNTDKLWALFVGRSAQAAAATFTHTAGSAPSFHHLLDPTTPASEYRVTWEHLLEVDTPSALCTIFAGFVGFLTSGVNGVLVGIGFYLDQPTGKWHCFVNDCPTGVAPVTVRYDVAATGFVATVPNRLKFVIDGPTKKVTWYINGIQVGTFTPGTPLDRMGTAAAALGPEVVVGGVVPANGSGGVRGYAGFIPLVRVTVGS